MPVQQAPQAAPPTGTPSIEVRAQNGVYENEELPQPGLAREIYFRDMIRVRPKKNDVFTQNGARQLTAPEFYRMVGRPDLASASSVRKTERTVLYTVGFLAFAAGVGSGIYVSSNAQNLNDPACFAQGVASYNQCVDRSSKTSLYGAALIGAGVVVGGLFATIAALTPDMVTSPDETAKLASQYNKNLVRRLSAEPRVQITPVLGKDGGGLAARFQF